MRIISNFKDFYDSAAIYGIDETIVFQRTMVKKDQLPDSFKKIQNFIYDFSGNNNRLSNSFLEKQRRTWSRIDGLLSNRLFNATFVICGKVYFGLCYSPSEGGKTISEYSGTHFNSLPPEVRPMFIMNEEDLNKLEVQIKQNLENSYIYANESAYNKEVLESIPYIRKNLIPEIVNLNKNADRLDLSELHFEYKSPLLMFSRDEKYGFQINPELRHYGIQSIFNPATLNQEISMYISGVLGNTEKEIINISDKDKIIGKGFDYKKSFRKEGKK